METARHMKALESAESVAALYHGPSIINTLDLTLTWQCTTILSGPDGFQEGNLGLTETTIPQHGAFCAYILFVNYQKKSQQFLSTIPSKGTTTSKSTTAIG